ncbi:hypothetical protein SLE2022_391990 [Rubroshorea leprosula]
MALCSTVLLASLNPPIPTKTISNIKDANPRNRTFLPATQKRRNAKGQSIVSLSITKTAQTSTFEEFCIDRKQKLETFGDRLTEVGETSSFESLTMIDAGQRLGIDHYFQDEIEQVLQKHYLIHGNGGYLGLNLHEVALRFRLLRQQGYYVSAGLFNEFKDSKGRFKQELSKQISGLIEFYEASQLSIEGEDILDEARKFSAFHLDAALEHLDHSKASMVEHILNHPRHKSVPRFMAMIFFLSDFQGSEEWIFALQEVAKMDFNMIQAYQIKGLNSQNLFSLIYIIDDIFDLYGTLEELTLFTQVVNRWDYTDMDQLPDCMKICLKALYDITKEISPKVYKQHGWNPIDSLKKTWASLFNAFLVEAKWFASGELPNPEEYLKNGVISSGVHVALVHIFFLLGEGFTHENVELLHNNPGIISSTATIFRLCDDLGSAWDENQDGQDGSYVDCYKKEHQGITVEDARKHVTQMISKAWKQLNQERLSPNQLPSSFTKATVNLARMAHLLYSNDENQCLQAWST